MCAWRVVCCALIVAGWCSLFAACCWLLCVFCGMLLDVRYLLFVVCCFNFVACCCLLVVFWRQLLLILVVW